MWERELIETIYAEHDFGPAAMVMLYAGFAGVKCCIWMMTGMRTFRRKQAHRARRGDPSARETVAWLPKVKQSMHAGPSPWLIRWRRPCGATMGCC